MAREVQTIKKNYTQSLMQVDKDLVEDFVMMENKRQIRNSQVSKIQAALNKGKHFESPIVVNQVMESKKPLFRIIDGNHRIEAIKRFLSHNPEKKIELNVAVYKELDKVEENEMFERWNKGLRQTSDDFVNLNASDLFILKLINKSFPVSTSIYGGPTVVKIAPMLKAYLGAKYSNSPCAFPGSSISLIEKAKMMGVAEHSFMSRYAKNILTYAGAPSRENIWFNSIAMAPTMRVIMDNPALEDDFWKKFEKDLRYDYELKMMGKGHGRDLQENFHRLLLNRLNTSKMPSKQFKLFDRKVSEDEEDDNTE